MIFLVFEIKYGKSECNQQETRMFPTINLKETGINLRRIMNKRGISAKDIEETGNVTA